MTDGPIMPFILQIRQMSKQKKKNVSIIEANALVAEAQVWAIIHFLAMLAMGQENNFTLKY
jgi:NO-binding membrane sensor protein with MHYT domain